jgi:hypothetical protein
MGEHGNAQGSGGGAGGDADKAPFGKKQGRPFFFKDLPGGEKTRQDPEKIGNGFEGKIPSEPSRGNAEKFQPRRLNQGSVHSGFGAYPKNPAGEFPPQTGGKGQAGIDMPAGTPPGKSDIYHKPQIILSGFFRQPEGLVSPDKKKIFNHERHEKDEKEKRANTLFSRSFVFFPSLRPFSLLSTL